MSKQAMLRIVAVALVLIAGFGFIALVARTPVAAKTRPRAVEPDPERTIAKRLPRDEQLRQEPLPEALEPLRSIAVPKVAPEPGDWLAEHPEDGQSIAQHKVDCRPVPQKVVYLVPVGALDAKATVVLTKLEFLLAAHFQLPVKRLPALPAAVAGKSERDGQLGKQWLTDDVLDGLMKVRPADAAAVMAFTTVDLYPDPSWNFVFGQASYDERVGVMSVARTGDLELEPELVLERSYATGMHEIGHMLQILHCIAWECPMNGCNHQDESDSRPLEPCPHCLAKLIRATGLDPMKRWKDLRAEFDRAGLTRGVKEIDAELAAMARGASSDAGVSSVP
ncbi:MAG: archaemetzincin [Archangium sp.]